MPTLSIDDFRHGLDVRKSPLTAIGGSLQIMQNVVLTNGGEIEKRRAFVNLGQMPAGTYGLFGQGGNLHTFGTIAAPVMPASPTPIIYHQIAVPPSGLAGVIDIEVYKNKFWLAVAGVNGGTYNYYDGVLLGVTNSFYGRIYRSKLYRTAGNLLRFSSVDNPALDDNTPASPGGGFIDVSANDPDGEGLAGLEIYYNQLAVFSRHTTQIWAVDPDPALNNLRQVLRIGSMAPDSILQFGTGDVLFLSDSGIRSLRALNSTLAAGVIDVGSPIDALIQAGITADLNSNLAARAVVLPRTQRFVLAVGTVAYVLSFFPAAKISAWSTWTLPAAVDKWAVVANLTYMRGTNGALYLYGGADGLSYDTSEVRIRTPHLSADKPTVMKKVQSLAAIATGAWTMSLGMVSDNVNLFEPVARFVGPTVAQHRIAAAGHGSHMAVELVNNTAGPATLSSVALNYDTNERL